MSTNPNPTAVPSISEADITAYMKAKQTELAAQFPELFDVTVSTAMHAGFWVQGYTDREYNTAYGSGATIAAAAAELRAKLGTPESKAAELRAKANELLAKAEALVVGKQPETSNA